MQFFKNFVVLIGLAISGPVFAEKGFVYEFLGPSGAGKTTTIKVLTGPISPSRMVINPGKDGALHADFEGRQIFVTDVKNQEYLDLGQIAESYRKSGFAPQGDNSAALEDLDAAQQILHDKLEEILAQMPEGQRDAARKALEKQFGLKPKKEKSKSGGATRVVESGQTDTHNGIFVTHKQIYTGDRLQLEVWEADPKDIEGGQELVDALDALQKLFDELVGDIIPKGGNSPVDGGGFLGGIAELDGFPVIVGDFDSDGSIEEESFLYSARRQTLDPDDFEPPSGYKRRTSFSP